jgi:FtsH-binding integral membrane protein
MTKRRGRSVRKESFVKNILITLMSTISLAVISPNLALISSGIVVVLFLIALPDLLK